MKTKPEKIHHTNENETSFRDIHSTHSAEGWGLDRIGKRFRVGYVQGVWWYEEGGFRGYRVYCDKKYIENNFVPITPLIAVKVRV